MMKLYCIATKVSQTYGHGDSGDELMIRRQGGYGSGEFPPLFPLRGQAEEYLEGMGFGDHEVVELVVSNVSAIEVFS